LHLQPPAGLPAHSEGLIPLSGSQESISALPAPSEPYVRVSPHTAQASASIIAVPGVRGRAGTSGGRGLAGPKDPFLQPSYVAFHGRPVDAGPVVEIATPACRFSAAHHLTPHAVPSAQQHRFGDTCRKSAPFRDGYCPIRPITGRPSLSPASSAPWPVSLPCGRATTRGWGPWGLPS
jgi:hypothetical protein